MCPGRACPREQGKGSLEWSVSPAKLCCQSAELQVSCEAESGRQSFMADGNDADARSGHHPGRQGRQRQARHVRSLRTHTCGASGCQAVTSQHRRAQAQRATACSFGPPQGPVSCVGGVFMRTSALLGPADGSAAARLQRCPVQHLCCNFQAFQPNIKTLKMSASEG